MLEANQADLWQLYFDYVGCKHASEGSQIEMYKNG